MEKTCPKTVDEVVEEIMRIHRSLPTRPGIEEVEAAKILIRNVENEEQSRLDLISKQVRSSEVPDELFMILQEMQRKWVVFKSKEEKIEALKLLDVDSAHQVFDELIQRASECLDSGTKGGFRDASLVSSESLLYDYGANEVPSSGFLYEKESVNGSLKLFTRDDSYVSMSKSTVYGDGVGVGVQYGDVVTPMIVDATLKPVTTTGNFHPYYVYLICAYDKIN